MKLLKGFCGYFFTITAFWGVQDVRLIDKTRSYFLLVKQPLYITYTSLRVCLCLCLLMALCPHVTSLSHVTLQNEYVPFCLHVHVCE